MYGGLGGLRGVEGRCEGAVRVQGLQGFWALATAARVTSFRDVGIDTALPGLCGHGVMVNDCKQAKSPEGLRTRPAVLQHGQPSSYTRKTSPTPQLRLRVDPGRHLNSQSNKPLQHPQPCNCSTLRLLNNKRPTPKPLHNKPRNPPNSLGASSFAAVRQA